MTDLTREDIDECVKLMKKDCVPMVDGKFNIYLQPNQMKDKALVAAFTHPDVKIVEL